MKPTSGKAAGYAACSGCGLCQLVCPAWRTHRDVLFTPHGRAKALQHGAAVTGLTESLASCSVCGACEAVCPERIPLVSLTLKSANEAGCPIVDDESPPLAEVQLQALRQLLNASDLYVIAPRAYHHDYERQVLRYAALRRDTGCMTNLDLQRIAIPADDAGQARWILQGRDPQRIVVERERDRAVFAALGDWPVKHVSELLAVGAKP
jgi:ferredoxin